MKSVVCLIGYGFLLGFVAGNSNTSTTTSDTMITTASSNETITMSSDRARKIREEFLRDQAYRDQLIREDAIRSERELQKEKEKQAANQPQRAIAPIPSPFQVPQLFPQNPLSFFPSQQQFPGAQGFAPQQSPMQQAQTFQPQTQQAFMPQQPAARNLDAQQLLSPGALSQLLQPKLLGQNEGSQQLIPPLVTSNLQGRAQQTAGLTPGFGQPQGLGQQQQTTGFNPQAPKADARQLTFPGTGNFLPSMTGFAPQLGQQNQFFPSATAVQQPQPQLTQGVGNFGASPLVNREFPNNNLMPYGQYNPALATNNISPLLPNFG